MPFLHAIDRKYSRCLTLRRRLIALLVIIAFGVDYIVKESCFLGPRCFRAREREAIASARKFRPATNYLATPKTLALHVEDGPCRHIAGKNGRSKRRALTMARTTGAYSMCHNQDVRMYKKARFTRLNPLSHSVESFLEHVAELLRHVIHFDLHLHVRARAEYRRFRTYKIRENGVA